jgi:hypothetical protein
MGLSDAASSTRARLVQDFFGREIGNAAPCCAAEDQSGAGAAWVSVGELQRGIHTPIGPKTASNISLHWGVHSPEQHLCSDDSAGIATRAKTRMDFFAAGVVSIKSDHTTS